MAVGSQVEVASDHVVGPEGRRGLVELSGRYTTGRWSLGAAMPLVYGPGAEGPVLGLGNLALDVTAAMALPRAVHQVAIHAYTLTTGDAATWLHRDEQVWPGVGGFVAWEIRTDGPTALLARAEAGVRWVTEDHPHFPRLTPHLSGALALDHTLGPVGFTLELAGQGWSLSPLELTPLIRVDPVPGLRLRAGVVLPYGTWAGWGRDDIDGQWSARQATLLAAVTVSPSPPRYGRGGAAGGQPSR